MVEPGVDQVVLLGFMGSGKSSVGRILARRLGWEHLDLDAEIEREQGRRITDIFREQGETRFRELEADITRRVAGYRRVVVSPGGGWITNPSLLREFGSRAVSVWLRVSPEQVLRRLAEPAHRRERPLLSGPDVDGEVRRLMREREPLYRLADLWIDTDGRAIKGVADEIEGTLRSRS